jgi:hypothetical protein
MSTKTTFKRIALVAVAALGLSLVAVAPSSAAPVAVNLYHTVYSANGNCNTAGSFACSPVTSDTSWVLVNETATYGFQTTFLAAAANDAVTHTWTPAGTGSLWQYPLITITNWKSTDPYGPAGGAAGGFTGGFDDNSGWGFAGTTAAAPTGAAVTNGTGTVSGLSAITTATAAGGTIGNFKNSFTPTVAGTYVWELKSAQGGPTYTWTINAYSTQAAKDAGMGKDNAINAAKTTSFLNTGETTTATADATVSASMALSASAQAATIVVAPKNAAGTAIANVTFPITATITGPGSLGIDTAANVASIASVGRAVTGTTGHYAIGVFSDGTAGVATVTISTGTTVLATETVTFYGAAASITPTVVNSVLAIGANVGAITAVVKDAAGVLVPGATVYAVSGTTAAVSNSYTSCGASSATGAVTCDLAGVAAGSAAITLTLNSASTGTSTVSAVAGTMRVSDGVATAVAYTFDKDTYAPGQAAVIKATVSNAAGVMPAGTYTVLTGAVTANYTISGLPTTTVLAVGSTGTASYTVTIPPGITGDLQLAGTSAATTIAATFGKATIVNAAQDTAQAAVDAAAEAIDAANAATDAANAAAEAADAATAAAQDAADAVAALSVSVAAMIDSLKKQITALTNLVIKIQKKVKA